MKQLYKREFIYIISLIYTLIPFLLFILFWIKLTYSFPLFVALLFCVGSIIKRWGNEATPEIKITPQQQKHFLISCLTLFVWVFFSGIGNLAYQNSDFDVRNAILHDLVEQDWPILYNSAIYSPAHPAADHQFLFVYYFGFWLPAAGIGKLFGIYAANLFLLAWTFLGLVLIFSLLSLYLKKVSYVAVLILIFWSGLDIVGTLLSDAITGVHTDLSPLSHLERWANMLSVYAQFSSNTTLLYWVFNQTIPLWIAILLFINPRTSGYIFFVLALSLFLAPIGTIGFLPFVLIQLLVKFYKQGSQAMVSEYLTVPNTLGASIILAVTVLFFTTNSAGSLKSIIHFDLLAYGTFFLLEAGILGVLLYAYGRYNRHKMLLLCIAFLFLIPFVKLGHFYDFGMRASIAYLFLLTIFTIEFLVSSETSKWGKVLVTAYLLIGGITPLLEISRSVFFTSSHALYTFKELLKENHQDQFLPKVLSDKIKDRPFLCDPIKTLNKYNPGIVIDQFVGKASGNLFADYLLNKPDQPQVGLLTIKH